MHNDINECIRQDVDDVTSIFLINRPHKLNAITERILVDLDECLRSMERSGRRLLVISGAGTKAFCAGTDLLEVRAKGLDATVARAARARELFFRIHTSPVLSIAAINGLAYGGGLELAMACSLRISVVQASFALPEVKLGLMPAYGGTQFLPALIGTGCALDLMLTGRSLTALNARKIGLVNRICGKDESIVQAALDYGKEIIAHAPEAVSGIRKSVEGYPGNVTSGGLHSEHTEVNRVFNSVNAERGLTAFLER